MDKDTVVTLLKYKRWIDLATLQAIRAIDGTVHGEKRHLTIRLMNHIHVVDMIFRANLRGRPHGYTALNTPETPTVDELETAMTACTDEYIQYVSAMTPADFHERIAFKFVDGGDGNMTAMEMLNHMLFHGAYHRGAVDWMIGECGGVPRTSSSATAFSAGLTLKSSIKALPVRNASFCSADFHKSGSRVAISTVSRISI